MSVKIITPLDQERLVRVDSPILIESTSPLSSVTVNGELALQSGVFQAGYSGKIISHLTGFRTVVYRNTPYVIKQNYNIRATSVSGFDRIIFQAGSIRITDTYDSENPRVVGIGANTWSGYVKEGTKIILRRGYPPSSEVYFVDGRDLDLSYDPYLDKIIVTWVFNGKLYFVTADVGDSPSFSTQPIDYRDIVLDNIGGGTPYNFTKKTFFPVKRAPLDSLALYANGYSFSYRDGEYNSPLPLTLTGAPNVLLRFTTPSTGFEADNILYVEVWKEKTGLPPYKVTSLSVSPNQTYTWLDNAGNNSIGYRLRAIYQGGTRGIQKTLLYGELSPLVYPVDPNSGVLADLSLYGASTRANGYEITLTTFTPTKKLLSDEENYPKGGYVGTFSKLGQNFITG